MADRLTEASERVDLAAQVVEHRRTAAQPGPSDGVEWLDG
jgi:hypothetical protein